MYRLLIILLLIVACDDGGTTTLDDDAFVDVLVDLRLAERRAEATDSPSVAFDSLRDEVLDRHGVTPEELRRYVELHSSNMRRLERVWETIEERLRRVEAADTLEAEEADTLETEEADTLQPDTGAAEPRRPEQDLEPLPLPEADTGLPPIRTLPIS